MADVIEVPAMAAGTCIGSPALAAGACGGSTCGSQDSTLQALGRLFVVCANGRYEQQQHQQMLAEELLVIELGRPLLESDEEHETREVRVPLSTAEGNSALMDLTGQGPYLQAAAFLDIVSLGCADLTCRTLRDLHRANTGAWNSLGALTFLGIEVEGEGHFQPSDPQFLARHNRLDWKGRYARFLSEMCTFREPFSGAEITQVEHADEIAYSRIRLCTDLLETVPYRGVYMEIEVRSNPDNVSMAVVNFDAGGCSSVTFSPDTGAVIRERKVCEDPRRVQGSYIQPLSTITHGQGFEGSMGLYLRGGHLAFFRRQMVVGENGEEPKFGPWETTGFITDLAWAEGKQLTPCLAFRDEGAYHVRTTCVSLRPPFMPERMAVAYEDASWNDLNWDADQELGAM